MAADHPYVVLDHPPTARCEYPDFATLGICTAWAAVQKCQPFTRTSARWDEWKASLDATSVNQSSIYASAPADCSYSYSNPSVLQITPDGLYLAHFNNELLSKADVDKHPGAIASIITAKYPSDEVIYTAANSSEFEQKPEITHCVVTLCEKPYTRNTATSSSGTLQPSRSQLLINATVFGTSSSDREHKPYVGLGSIIYNSGSVTDSFSHMASSITNQICSGAKGTHVRGLAIRTETFVHVRWPWILVPTILVAMSLVFFLSMAFRSRGQPVLWKSSIFPLLIGQLETNAGHEIAHLRHVGKMQGVAKNINVVVGVL
ncbi:uncharacterized protein APUU_70143A [Aspergillus puulaauensis]|uniref:Uncharacterized protein n=1 Tax=Aspergillus puulaauensis TaxID=1220207 RepID=A0A7R7XX55_9EURO|nr:uncharacterized protein APUU_70143A [Aspergillus puulaauensis]BCS28573.1 hypothetical protein APUU_70143A [Aspergillus puulaauensis]